MRRITKTLLTLAVSALPFSASLAQTYPMRPINIIVPLGAGGTFGTAKASKSAPDGYTITIASSGTHAINPGLYANPGYDPIKDFAPIALVGSVTNALIVHPGNPARTPQDVTAAVRAKPGELSYSSGGVWQVDARGSGAVVADCEGCGGRGCSRAQLLSAHSTPGVYAVLIGSGRSRSARIPTVLHPYLRLIFPSASDQQ